MAALRRISYLEHASTETISHLAHSLKGEWVETGTIICHPGDRSEVLFIVHNGQIEVMTQMDNGTPLLIETLERGSIIF